MFDALPDRPPPAARPRPAPSPRCAARTHVAGRDREQLLAGACLAGDTDADRAAGGAYDALHNRLFTDPLLGRGLPGRASTCRCATATSTIDRRADRRARGQLLQPDRHPRAVDAGLRRCRSTSCRWTGYPRTDFGWPVVPDGLRELLVGLRPYGDYGLPLYVTESGCAYARPTPRTTSAAIDYLAGHIARRSRGDRRRASTCAATSSGPCWTTSSGPRASPSGSAWCTSTSTRRRARPKASYAWFRDRRSTRP